nr:hypothetical protein CFP56_11575 [Quercus suber]
MARPRQPAECEVLDLTGATWMSVPSVSAPVCSAFNRFRVPCQQQLWRLLSAEPKRWDTRLACVGRLITPDWLARAIGFSMSRLHCGVIHRLPALPDPGALSSRDQVLDSGRMEFYVQLPPVLYSTLYLPCTQYPLIHRGRSASTKRPLIKIAGKRSSGELSRYQRCWRFCFFALPSENGLRYDASRLLAVHDWSALSGPPADVYPSLERIILMSPPGADKDTHELSSSCSVTASPLIIVSAQGHNTESRRIVRAQAARASAAQSRVTRARNREDRARDIPQSPPQRTHGRPRDPKLRREQRPQSASVVSSSSAQLSNLDAVYDATSNIATEATSALDLASKPMIRWIVALLNLSTTVIGEGTATLTNTIQHDASKVSRVVRNPRSPVSIDDPSETEISGLRLPVALPRGFAALQQRIQISRAMLELLSRTACVDLASPGVERRLHQLLFDLVIVSAGTALSSVPANGHPIQGHLRVVCFMRTAFTSNDFLLTIVNRLAHA